MKKLIFATALLAVMSATYAQDNATAVSFGVKGGLNLSNLSSKYEDETESADMKPGIHAGVFARFSLMQGFAFQPELLFSAEGAKETEDDVKSKLKLGYLQVPLMLQFGSASGFYGEVGPGFGFLMSAKAKYEFEDEEEEEDIKEDMEKMNITGNIGVGYATEGGFGVGVRYVHGFSNLIKDGGDIKMHTRTIQLSLFKRF
jgi:hypothetical protein